MERTVHFILHIPKCAGTTVERHFEQALGTGFMIAPRWNHFARDLIGNRYNIAPAALAGLRVVSGHSLSTSLKRHFPPGTRFRESVLLRDPLDWHLSYYNYLLERHEQDGKPRPLAFPLWYRLQLRNPIARFLMLRYFGIGYPRLYAYSSRRQLRFLLDALSRFHAVVDIAQAGTLIKSISEDLGLNCAFASQNITRSKSVTRKCLGPSFCAQIRADHALDGALHRLSTGAASGSPDLLLQELHGLSAYDAPRYFMTDVTNAIAKKTVHAFGRKC